MSEQENLKAAQAFFDAWNAGDLSQGAPYQADGYVAEGPGAAGPMNKEQNRMYLQNFLTAFPGSKFEILLTVAQGDYVVMHWKVGGGAHTGPLHIPSGGVIPPTGKPATIVGSTTSQVKNGKVTRTWTFWDMTSLLGQFSNMSVRTLGKITPTWLTALLTERGGLIAGQVLRVEQTRDPNPITQNAILLLTYSPNMQTTRAEPAA